MPYRLLKVGFLYLRMCRYITNYYPMDDSYTHLDCHVIPLKLVNAVNGCLLIHTRCSTTIDTSSFSNPAVVDVICWAVSQFGLCTITPYIIPNNRTYTYSKLLKTISNWQGKKKIVDHDVNMTCTDTDSTLFLKLIPSFLMFAVFCK